MVAVDALLVQNSHAVLQNGGAKGFHSQPRDGVGGGTRGVIHVEKPVGHLFGSRALILGGGEVHRQGLGDLAPRALGRDRECIVNPVLQPCQLNGKLLLGGIAHVAVGREGLGEEDRAAFPILGLNAVSGDTAV